MLVDVANILRQPRGKLADQRVALAVVQDHQVDVGKRRLLPPPVAAVGHQRHALAQLRPHPPRTARSGTRRRSGRSPYRPATCTAHKPARLPSPRSCCARNCWRPSANSWRTSRTIERKRSPDDMNKLNPRSQNRLGDGHPCESARQPPIAIRRLRLSCRRTTQLYARRPPFRRCECGRRRSGRRRRSCRRRSGRSGPP